MKIQDLLEGWSNKYKKSINCSNPKGFSQRVHCQGRKKNESLEPNDIHKLADKKNVKWDNDLNFLNLSKKLTGVEHLDDMDQKQLQIMYDYLKSLKEKRFSEASYVGNIGIMELIKFFQEYPEHKPMYNAIKEKEGAIAAMKFALEKMKIELVGEPFVNENFADGKIKGKSRPGRVKRAGASCKA